MNDGTDQQLLREYALRQTQAAFAEVVHRHVDLVHSAARRLMVDPHLAEDVTQNVFVALARQAGPVARKLEQGAPLSGWLHVTTRNLAVMAIRAEERRRAREQEAVTMQQQQPETGSEWERIAPHLDHALAELLDADRDALLLRFFERKSAREIGERFGLSEEAAQKRVSRALDRLRSLFVARGLAVPSASLAGVLTVHAVQTAPVALAGAVAAGATAAAGVATLSTLGIVMASTKLKLGVAALVAAGMATTLVLQQRENQRLRTELAELQTRPETPAAAVRPETNAVAPAGGDLEELLQLRGEVAQLRQQQAQMAKLQAENQHLRATQSAKAARREADLEAQEDFKRMGIAKMNYTRNWGIAFMMFAEEHQGMMPKQIEEAAAHFSGGGEGGGFNTEEFELLYQGSLKTIKEPARTIILREKTAFPNQNGTGWLRTYLFADGHSEIHRADDGNFEAWEQERLVQAKAD